ncbi:hypothetical protein JG687_00011143, partial [Phytophthora cactorum]
ELKQDIVRLPSVVDCYVVGCDCSKLCSPCNIVQNQKKFKIGGQNVTATSKLLVL